MIAEILRVISLKQTNKKPSMYLLSASIVILECVIDLPFVEDEDAEGVALH